MSFTYPRFSTHRAKTFRSILSSSSSMTPKVFFPMSIKTIQSCSFVSTPNQFPWRRVMEIRKIMVIVEEAEVAKAALRWALNNILRYGDQIILAHVFTPTTRSRNNKKQRVLRLKGFQLALAFKEVCDTVLDVKVEIIVREGDQEGSTIASMVKELRVSDLVLGLHDHSFLHRMSMIHTTIREKLNCRVFAIKQTMPKSRHILPTPSFSLVDINGLSVPSIIRPKIRYQILPSIFDIIWRSKQRRKRKCFSRLYTSSRGWTLFSVTD